MAFHKLVATSSTGASLLLRRLEGSSSLWSKLPTARSGSSKDFLLGGSDSEAGRKLSYRFFVNKEERELQGVVHYGSHAEGPRGHAHGGATAAVLDVACGSLCWWLGEIVVTGSLEVKYRRLIPLGTSLVLNARVTETQGKKLLVSAELCDALDEEGFGGGRGDSSSRGSGPYAEAKCTFIQIDRSAVGWADGESWEGGQKKESRSKL